MEQYDVKILPAAQDDLAVAETKARHRQYKSEPMHVTSMQAVGGLALRQGDKSGEKTDR
ncbi:MAG: hypothetical protein LBQ90_09480 [Synergistaceae bacterium]|jgi:hypothetical protein|nr:hypothetical protein [Synergistaceae bacterium]